MEDVPLPSAAAAPAHHGASGAASAADLTPTQKALTLAGIMLGMFLAALDQTIVSTAGPVIRKDLEMPASLYGWLTTSYMVASTVLVPIYGKLSDVYGRKPVLLTGMIIFLAGSAASGASTSYDLLFASRALQGAGSGALFITAFAVVADLFPPAVRAKYTGMVGGVWALAGVIGPLVGGLLTDHLSWHWVFFVNLPLGAIAVAFVVAKMPRLGGGQRRRLDLGGAIGLCVTVIPLLLALSLGSPGPSDHGPPTPSRWTDPEVLALFAVAAVGLVAFVAVEQRAADPIVDLQLFDAPIFRWGVIAVVVAGSAFFVAIIFLPLFMQAVLGVDATRSGIALIPLTLGIVAGNIGSGQLVSRLGRYKPLMLIALAGLAGAYALLGVALGPHSTQLEVTGMMVLVGVSLGPSVPLYVLAMQNGMPPQKVGAVTAQATFFRQIGGTIGIAALMTVFATQVAGAMTGAMAAAATDRRLAILEGLSAATRDVFRVGAGIAILAFVITLKLPEIELRKTHR